MGIRVFWVEPTELERVWLRRYNRSDEKCAANNWCHDAMQLVDDAAPKDADRVAPPHDDPHWPRTCACGYAFSEDDHWQVFDHDLFRGAPDGKLYTLREAPVGAMWDASLMRGEDGDLGRMYTGPDGLSLVVRTPGGDWHVDSQCSNCTRDQYGPGEDESGRRWERMWQGRTHYCWVRHGDPRAGVVHVDKNGETCAAGAGSIQAGSYHGFLHNSELTSC